MKTDKVNILAIRQIEHILKSAGAERISDDASIELEKELVNYGIKISMEAVSIAADIKRKTIRSEDIRLAIEKVKAKEEIANKKRGTSVENRKDEVIEYLNNDQYYHAFSSMRTLMKNIGYGTTP